MDTNKELPAYHTADVEGGSQLVELAIQLNG